MRWLRAAVVGALLALVVVAARAPAQEDDAVSGYPPGWPSGVACPTVVEGRDLDAVDHRVGKGAGFSDEQAVKLTCRYAGVRLITDYRLPEYTGDIDWCNEKDVAQDFYTLRYSETHQAWVESEFGPSTNAVMADFLVAAESLAKPCGSPTTSSSIAPTTGPCAIDGVVTAPDKTALADVEVDLEGPGRIELASTGTDASGHYHFDPPASTDRFSAERDDAEIVVRLRDPRARWELWHVDSESGVRTKPIKVARQSCTVDIDLGDLDSLAGANPSEDDRWPAMVAMARRLARMARFVADPKGLGFTMDNHLPVKVYAWCDAGSPVSCPTVATATEPEAQPFYVDGGDPHIVLGPVESAAQGVAGCEGDVLGHEWGHAVTADLFGGVIPNPAAGHTNHGGYYVNRSSNDSWVEGLATYLGMAARNHGGGPRSPTYRWCAGGGAVEDYEENLHAWGANGKNEERAVAGLLLDLEDGPADYQRTRVASYVDRDVALLVMPGGPRGKVIVGRVKQRRGPDVSVRVELLKDGRDVVGGYAELDEDGWFYLPIPTGTPAFTSVRAYGIRGGGRGADDDPIDATPREVWDAIAAYDSTDLHGDRPVDVTGVFDVDDLYAALGPAFGGDRDQNGIDDVDQLFRDHGFFADPEGDRTFAPGSTIGRTDRPVGDGAAVERHDVTLPPATRVAVHGDDATFIVSITHPAPDDDRGYSYIAEPASDGRIVVAVPEEDSGATVSILAVAPGHLPNIVEVIEPAEFWKDAAAHDDEPFLDIDVQLEPGDLDGSSGGSAPPVALGGGVLALGIALAFVGRRRLPVLLVAVAIAGAGIGVGAWSVLGDGGGRPGTEIALAADPDLPVFDEDTVVEEEATSTTSTTSTSTTTTTTAVTAGDPDRVLTAAGWFASDTLASSASDSYGPDQAGDGDPATAWCVGGDGSGASITAAFAEPTVITVVGLVPGYDKVDPATGRDRWDENRHVIAATWSFDDGTVFADEIGGEREMQYFVLAEPIVTEGVMLTIDRTDGVGDTCVSEIELRGHPASED